MSRPDAVRRFEPRRALALAAAETRAFWGGASGGLALLAFLGLGGLWFYNSVAAYAVDNLRAMTRGGLVDANLTIFSGGLANLGLLMALVTPLTTMRAFADSSSGGHLDLWRSWPVGRWELALGLHLSAFGALALLGLLGLAPFLALMAMGVGGWALMGVSALGLLMAAAAFPAVGLAVGALARTPLAAALATLAVLGLLWAVGFAAPYLPAGAGTVVQGLAFGPRLARLAAGLLDLGDVAYFLALTLGGLWLARPPRG